MTPTDPRPDCRGCPRLVGFRTENAAANPDWFNGAVPGLGSLSARLLIVGLAPGLRGGNRTGIPFTGDSSGDLLFSGLAKTGFATQSDDPQEPPSLTDCLITNAVRCVPPGNRPLAAEINTCRAYLGAQIQAMPSLRAILCLGRVAHDSTLRALAEDPAKARFAHGARYESGQITVFDSFHCSRYNINTRRLTVAMFEDVLRQVGRYIRNV